MIRFITLIGLVVLLQFTTWAQGKKGQPNIILIVSDDHSAPFLGCYGYADIKTPNIDKLAAEGIIFKKAYTTAPQCVLSRAAIMTGRNTLDIQMTRFSAPLDASVTSYPELLRKGGYHTGIVGRNFHLDGNRRVPETVAVLEKYSLETFKNRVDYLNVSGNRDTIFQQYTAFLDQAPKGKPFFVQVGYSDPHRVFNAKNFEPDPAKISVPAHWPDTKLLREDFAAYLGEIQRLDSDVGRVLEDLKKRGLDQNTLVVFIGDNGGALLRGKGTLYDLGIHVPLIIRHPGLIKAGQTSDALVSGIDVAPTFLSVAGLPVPKEITGRSLAPAFSNPQFAGHDHIFAVRGAHGQGLPTNSSNFDLGRTIFNKKYKLIYNAIWQIPYHPVDFAGQPFWLDLKQKHAEGALGEPFDKLLFADHRQMFELYDEEKDPFETNNLAGKPETKQIEHELKSRLQEWMILNRDYLPLPIAP
jgi:N-sulfoglucosamine sulfohydrolase